MFSILPILALIVLLVMLALLLLRQWNIHGTDYQRKAQIRRLFYTNPITKRFLIRTQVTPELSSCGWKERVALPLFGLIAYVRHDGEVWLERLAPKPTL